MEIRRHIKFPHLLYIASCLLLLAFATACQAPAKTTTVEQKQIQPTQQPSPTPTPQPTTQQGGIALPARPTPAPTATAPVTATTTPAQTQPPVVSTIKPVLAFYYPWYNSSSWSQQKMPDLPTIHYNSNEPATIDRHLAQASNAGISGFISSWWGAGDATDKNFATLLARSATLQQANGYQFASSIYFEADAPSLKGTNKMVSALQYVIANYSSNSHFFHWGGKPVIFFWAPLGNGRTLAQWEAIRQQVDPAHQTIWSAEGVDTTLLDVFDGLHLFSAAYWGILNKNITAVDQGFRTKITAYNQAHKIQKIWAAGVLPGSDDTRVPGRQGTYIVERKNGTTYRQSWEGAIASGPEWITITTFNEWFEGSMIEPSVTYGDLYLTLTREYTAQWRR